MKRLSVLGVTLLEIMLVLAIAAMVVVMSIRYYQAARASQQANDVLELLSIRIAWWPLDLAAKLFRQRGQS